MQALPLMVLVLAYVHAIAYTTIAVVACLQDTMAASLCALLAHPSYGVRFEAAVALASLGSALPWCAAGLLQQVIPVPVHVAHPRSVYDMVTTKMLSARNIDFIDATLRQIYSLLQYI